MKIMKLIYHYILQVFKRWKTDTVQSCSLFQGEYKTIILQVDSTSLNAVKFTSKELKYRL